MSYLDHIKNCNHYEADHFIPFYVNDEQLGWTLKTFAENLKAYPSVFLLDDNNMRFNSDFKTPQQRSEAIAPVLWELHQTGVIDSWVDELYAVNQAFDETPRFVMERAAVSFFGVRGYGVHLNGLVKKKEGVYIWVARRTKDKPFWPGKLDQMVAGGQPVGIGLMENMIKESEEEAAIPKSLASEAEFVSTLHYCGEGIRGMNIDTLYNYDLWLPEDFAPENTDGEVDEFILMPLEEMAHITETSVEFKNNCNLVNIDLLLRHGVINESHRDYEEIRLRLYAIANL
ncbi:MAG: DUF4743 domain-containing protein [Cocleimonas sp.]